MLYLVEISLLHPLPMSYPEKRLQTWQILSKNLVSTNYKYCLVMSMIYIVSFMALFRRADYYRDLL